MDTEKSTFKFVRQTMDSDNTEYVFAGMLIGSSWKFPDGYNLVVKEIKQQKDKIHGAKVTYPEVNVGDVKRFRVNSFLTRTDPNDIGDVKPTNPIANRIVDLQKGNKWRNLELQAPER